MIVPYIREKIFDGMPPGLKDCIIKKINESLKQYNVNNNNVNNNEFILNDQSNITDLNLRITDNEIFDLQNIFDDINIKITEIEDKSTSTYIVNNDQGQGEGINIKPAQKQGRLNLRA